MTMRSDRAQQTLFDEVGQHEADDEDRTARARRLNRERQRVWRQRHRQFYVPADYIESPTGCGRIPEARSTQ